MSILRLLPFVLLPTLLLAQLCGAQIGGTAGTFTRLGFGARGQGMGNALTAVPRGVISSLYNPALTPFQQGAVVHGSYSILALDRKLNQVSYTQGFKLYGKMMKDGERELVSTAGVSAGWMNAGDADIQGYDSDGFRTKTLSVFENQFFLNFGNRFSDRLSAGFNVKFYYSGLYEGVTSTGFGIDLGILFSVSEQIHVAAVAQELLTKYKWDTGSLYGPQSGNATEDSFARILRLGVSYLLPANDGLVSADAELFDGETILLRAGAEYAVVEQFTVRAGIERIDPEGKIEARPSVGISISQPIAQFLPIVSYALIFEPVAPVSTHVLSVALSF